MASPYERLLEQQERLQIGDTPVGFAVVIASPRTQRAAYLSHDPDDYLTNDERRALIANKEEATEAMTALHHHKDWYRNECYKHAFLVPVFDKSGYYNGLPTVYGF